MVMLAHIAPILMQTTQPVPGDGLRQLFKHLQLGPTFTNTSWQEWLWLLLAIFIGVVLGRVAQTFLKATAERLRRRGWSVQALIFDSLDGPVQLTAITLALGAGVFPILKASAPPVQSAIMVALRLLAVIVIGWLGYNLVDVLAASLNKLVTRKDQKLDQQVVSLICKTLRIFFMVVIVLFGAQFAFGADISAWLAGLGIAGLAVSLAAQDSLKNLFGSITVLLDHPFKVGDRVVIDGHEGPVEEIGLRSTKLRKITGELVTIPNSKVVDASVVNVQLRPNIPRIFSLTVPYDTPPEKVAQAVKIVRDILAEPELAGAFDLEKLPPRVFFDAFNADSLNIKVWYWFSPSDNFWAFVEHAEKFNMKVLRAFNNAGIEFAFPTQTLFLAGDSKRPVGASASEPAPDPAPPARRKRSR